MCKDKCKDKCRITVTVEDDFAPCHRPENCFDIEIRSRDGCETACGRVTGGSSAVFELPCKNRKGHDDDCDCGDDCGKDYSVTVTGGVYSSPRAQTRRVRCCCEETAGVTFIFMTFEPDCCEPEPCCPPPCRCECECECKPHKPKKEHECEEADKKHDCCECECKCECKPPKPHKPKKEQAEEADKNQVTAEE